MATSIIADLSAEFSKLVARGRERIVSVGAGKATPRTGIVLGDGEILTVARMAENGEKVPVHLGDKEYEATVTGFDPASGLALLKQEELKAEGLGETALPEVGSLTVTVASPIPGDYEARLGMVRCVGGETRTPGGRRIGTYFQTDSTRFRGFAGSVVFDGSGGVLGITMPVSRREEGFVIPTAELVTIVTQLREGKVAGTGYLGVQATAVDLPEPRDGHTAGLLITGVEPGSPADNAGLHVGTFIVSVGGQATADLESLYDALTGLKDGEKIGVGIAGAGNGVEEVKITVMLRK